MTKSSSKQQGQQKGNGWRGVIIWTLLALLLRWQVLEPRWIPSGSMLPTLQLKDKILVEKVTPKINRILNHHSKIGDLVIFHPPEQLVNAGYIDKSALIKRIVGLPGDHIAVKKGSLIRNEEPIQEEWLLESMNYEMETIIVPEQSLWVLGDNRNNSLDSHLWGPLPERNIIGTAILRYWPIKEAALFGSPSLSK